MSLTLSLIDKCWNLKCPELKYFDMCFVLWYLSKIITTDVLMNGRNALINWTERTGCGTFLLDT